MNKIIRHFITITKHKWYVGIECFKRGLFIQGILHDLSKYSFTEFFISAKYFQGGSSPIDREKNERGYSIAWLNHKAKNKHHWVYWTDRKDGKEIAIPMPEKYIQEMLCDYIGAGKAYNKAKWTPNEPLRYYEQVDKDKMFLHPETRKRFEELLSRLNKTL
jgi:hypothetical protein